MSRRLDRGFTLLEILAVLLIISFVFAMFGRKLFSRERKIQAAFQSFIVLSRRLSTAAAASQSIHRLALRINPDGPESYWVEKQPAGGGGFEFDRRFFPSPQKFHPLLEITSVEFAPGPYGRRQGGAAEPLGAGGGFAGEIDEAEPRDESGALDSWGEAITQGPAYIYYSPKGLARETAIQVFRPDNQGRWTLYLHPVQKEMLLLKSEKSLREIKGL